MKKQSEQLFESITNIDDELLEEALKENVTQKQFNWKPLLAAAACLITIIIGKAVFSSNQNPLNFISTKTEKYQSYAGPVLPLTVREKDSDIEAARNINFDFSSYNSEETYQFYSTVSDKYQITNKSADKKTVEFLYPFAGSYAKLTELLPVIKKDSENISAELLAGNYTGGFLSGSFEEATSDEDAINLKSPEDWQDYYKLLQDGSYVENLFAPPQNLDTPVTVYQFSGEHADITDNIDLVVDLKFDPEKTKILSYGFNGSTFDDENNSRTYRATIPQDAPQILIVIGDDLKSWDVSKKNMNSGKSGFADRKNVSRETTSLDSILTYIEKDFMRISSKMYETEIEPYVEEIYYQSFIKELTAYGALSSREVLRYSGSILEDMLSDVFYQDRVFYLKFTLELPPSSETAIDITLKKNSSHNYSCSGKEKSHGYDLLTKAGSVLTFTEQNASITNAENITILEQSLGFDLENNILSVPLDMKEEHYYLKIQ